MAAESECERAASNRMASQKSINSLSEALFSASQCQVAETGKEREADWKEGLSSSRERRPGKTGGLGGRAEVLGVAMGSPRVGEGGGVGTKSP